jgi:AraC-like DNA-binding protein
MSINASISTESIQELCHLGFQRILPRSELSFWVDSFWFAKSSLAKEYHEKLYPDGGSSLLFQFSGTKQQGVWFNSQQQLHQISFNGEVDIVGVRFKPGGAYALLGLPVIELTSTLSANDLNLKGVNSLFEQLEYSTIDKRIQLIESWLMQCKSLQQANNEAVQRLTEKLIKLEANVSDISKEVGFGRRRVERFFREQIGIAPNQLKMLLRVKKARYLIKQNPTQIMANVAYLSGYFDQAHFSHQFKRVTGFTPGEYQKRQRGRLFNKEMLVKPI